MFDRDTLRDAIRHEGGVSRRLFLGYAAALAAIPTWGMRTEGGTARRTSFAADPFSAGVTSGEPTPDGVVIWTRLAPEPLAGDGGMPPENVAVRWEVANDEAMTDVVRRGRTVATPQLGHSVHVEVAGLEPDRWYFYRFRAGDADSPVGRTRTTPARNAMPEKLRFAFASCQHYEQGLFTALGHMAEDDPDLIIHLGDYIYEYAGRDGLVRKHVGGEITSLDDYRVRYAQYKTDPLLQKAHARCPWVVTWDDHEFDNNYADRISEEQGIDVAEFLARRANAYQAYYEMMPLRRRSLPIGPDMRLYRSVPYGRLADFQVLDTRQYRDDQPNNDRTSDLNDAAFAPGGSILGRQQYGWLQASLLRSRATWNVLAQQVMVGMVDLRPGEERGYSMDKWTGYGDERARLMRFLADRRVPNPVVLTGDIHTNWVNDLRVDDRRPDEPVIGTEFVGTSLSSGGNGVKDWAGLAGLMSENPCVRYHNRERGYVTCTVTPKKWRSDYRVVEEVTMPGAPAVTRASFVVEDGTPGAKPA